MKKLNFAIIGCGRISYKHLRAINELRDNANLVAVCDIVEEKASAKAKEHLVPYYLDYHEMMQKHPEIDVVSVLVPSGHHASVVVDIAQYGRHIITEKPMALKVEDCDSMIRACKDAGIHLFVIYQNRYNLAVRAAKDEFEKGKFGKIVLSSVRVRWCRKQEYYDMDNWHGTWELDGGVISQQATHHIDLMQYFCGEVESLNCISATRLLDIEVEDTAAAILRFKSGAIGVFEATVGARPKDLEGSLSVLGENGNVVIGGHAVNEIKSWSFVNEEEGNLEMILKNPSEKIENIYGNGHSPNIYDIIQVIQKKKQSSMVCDGKQGKRNIEILTAMYESTFCNGLAIKPGAKVIYSPLGKKKRDISLTGYGI